MVTLLIIADDFTGALDTSVHFAKRQISTLATTNRDIDFWSLPPDIQVLAIDTETRHLPGEEAYRIVLDVARRAVKAGIPYLYKKTDSTLRGNIGAELSALMDGLPCGAINIFETAPSTKRCSPKTRWSPSPPAALLKSLGVRVLIPSRCFRRERLPERSAKTAASMCLTRPPRRTWTAWDGICSTLPARC